MTRMVRQSSFAIGEVDEINYRRTDLPSYLRAAKSLKNMEIGLTGLAVKRKGVEIISNITSLVTSKPRILKFQDENYNWVKVIAVAGNYHLFVNDVFEVSLPNTFTEQEIIDLDHSPINGDLVIVQEDHPESRIFFNGTDYVLEDLKISVYPSYDFGKINYDNFNVTYADAAGTITLVLHGAATDPGFDNNWVGGLIIGKNIDDPEAPIGYAIIESVSYDGGAQEVTFVGKIKQPFTIPDPGGLKGSDFSIQQPIMSASLGYSNTVDFFQNRLWLAGFKALPLGFAGSYEGRYLNFDIGVGFPSDAIVKTIAEADTGRIIYINSGEFLELYTDFAEYVAIQPTNSTLTPETLSIVKASSYGSVKSCKPINYGNYSYYLAKNRSIYQFEYSPGNESSYNISYPSSHLIKRPFDRSIRIQGDVSENTFIYYFNIDSTIATYQYNTQLKLSAWTPLSFDEDIEVLSADTIDNQTYMILKLSKTNEIFLTRFTNDEIYLDLYSTKTLPADGIITGLDNFEGYKVSVVFESQDFGEYLVEDGQITVLNPEGKSGNCFVGILYDAEVQTLPLYAGTMQTDFFKTLFKSYIEYYNSLDFFVNGKLVKYQNFDDIMAGRPLAPKNGVEVLPLDPQYKVDHEIVIRQRSPFPLNIQSISYQIKPVEV